MRARETRLSLRDRLIEHAARMTSQGGWGSITMAGLADDAGVSRQTVYNEIGGKSALAEAMVMAELSMFLGRVDVHFAGHDDLIGSIRGAATEILELARDNPLLRAILSSSHGAESDLLPLLTTESEGLLEAARTVIRGHVEKFHLQLSDRHLDACIDMVVRVVLSHVMQPGGEPEEVAADVAWMAQQVLRVEQTALR